MESTCFLRLYGVSGKIRGVDYWWMYGAKPGL